MNQNKNIAVIGGGAAGFFAALSVKYHHPKYEVCLFEKTSKVLAKVKVSGGGRCNVTNNTLDIDRLIEAYPRGGKNLKNIFYRFNTNDTKTWFEERGVILKTESDGRVFPVSNSSQTIIDCLTQEANSLGVKIEFNVNIKSIKLTNGYWELKFDDSNSNYFFDRVIVASGGSPKESGFYWLKNLGHIITSPVPSLFTFNLPKNPVNQLMGLVVKKVRLKVKGTDVETQGPLLITHWGMSGPAILVASAFAARDLAKFNYEFEIEINWLQKQNTELLFQQLQHTIQKCPHKTVSNQKSFDLPNRLWQFLLQKSDIPLDRHWNELGKKQARKFIDLLTHDTYTVSGKTTFKEEFVTCGGIALESINLKTLESKNSKGLYFAGEVLDIDAITGGYNFQAAWSTGFIAGQLG